MSPRLRRGYEPLGFTPTWLDTVLLLICSGIDRLWRQTEQLLHPGHSPRLSRRNARLINTFSRGETSQDPIQPLQNAQSRTRYIQTWQKLICYWSRVMDDQALPTPLFQPTEGQTTTWDDVLSAAQDLDDYDPSEPNDAEVFQFERLLEEQILCFCLEIIQQPLPSQAFDSILVSFAALLFWSPTQKQWMMVGNYTSYLSQLIYSCQIWTLALSILEHQHHPELDLGKIATKCGINPKLIVRILRVNLDGRKTTMDDDMVQKMPEEQDMLAEFTGVCSPQTSTTGICISSIAVEVCLTY